VGRAKNTGGSHFPVKGPAHLVCGVHHIASGPAQHASGPGQNTGGSHFRLKGPAHLVCGVHHKSNWAGPTS
jgi:hypothetical protein